MFSTDGRNEYEARRLREERLNHITLVSTWVFFLLLAIALISTILWAWPKYRVYSMELRGVAALAEAENARQVTVRQAIADRDAAAHLAAAEIERANGVAEANRIIADGLGGPEGYLRYLAIDGMKDMARSNNTTVVYVPTDGNIPVTEATRFNKPQE